ncbi:hypothetical protein B0H19DRAFT_299124 [Mycena capillaripes]|nr:hypothetical protein B0H19DRAFT_299124 [Mycena capillaripes]
MVQQRCLFHSNTVADSRLAAVVCLASATPPSHSPPQCNHRAHRRIASVILGHRADRR